MFQNVVEDKVGRSERRPLVLNTNLRCSQKVAPPAEESVDHHRVTAEFHGRAELTNVEPPRILHQLLGAEPCEALVKTDRHLTLREVVSLRKPTDRKEVILLVGEVLVPRKVSLEH